jgi:hypothetical protein
MPVCVPIIFSVCTPPELSTSKLTVPRSGEGTFGNPVTVALMLEKFGSEPAQVMDPAEAIQAIGTAVLSSKICKLVMALAGDIEANPAVPASKAAKVSFLIFSPPIGVPSSLPV